MSENAGFTEPQIRPRAGKVPEVAAYLGISRAKAYEEFKAGRIKFLKIDGATLVEYAEADRWFEERARPAAV